MKQQPITSSASMGVVYGMHGGKISPVQMFAGDEMLLTVKIFTLLF